MNPRLRLLFLLPLAVLVFTACPKRGLLYDGEKADIVVAKDGSGDYTTIGAAIAAAEDGALIGVKPGIYVEEVEITLARDITLFGSGPEKTVIDAGGEYAAVTLASDDVTISGFTLTGGASHGLYVKDGHHTIEHCLIRDNEDRGIYLSNMFGDGSAEISFCTIVNNQASGIYSIDDNPETEITCCIIANNGRGVVSDADESGMTIENNVMDNTGEDFDRVSPGDDNVVADPMFADPENGNFKLKKGSPAINIDGEGNNAGCF